MPLIRAAALIALLAVLTACAGGRGPHHGPPGGWGGGPEGDGAKAAGPAAGLQMSERLLAGARDTQAKEGCAKAAPTYRVIASFGEGYDVAQYELGACLLEMTGQSLQETALFREEALFWLRRAAYAGNARAQLKLANMLSGENFEKVEGVSAAPEEAMGWELVYQGNATRDLYDLPKIASEVTAHIQAALAPDAMKRAEAFAKDFDIVKMAVFTPPRFQRGEGRGRQEGFSRGGPEGGRRRPRQ